MVITESAQTSGAGIAVRIRRAKSPYAVALAAGLGLVTGDSRLIVAKDLDD